MTANIAGIVLFLVVAVVGAVLRGEHSLSGEGGRRHHLGRFAHAVGSTLAAMFFAQPLADGGTLRWLTIFTIAFAFTIVVTGAIGEYVAARSASTPSKEPTR